jgi:hypothetical protein
MRWPAGSSGPPHRLRPRPGLAACGQISPRPAPRASSCCPGPAAPATCVPRRLQRVSDTGQLAHASPAAGHASRGGGVTGDGACAQQPSLASNRPLPNCSTYAAAPGAVPAGAGSALGLRVSHLTRWRWYVAISRQPPALGPRRWLVMTPGRRASCVPLPLGHCSGLAAHTAMQETMWTRTRHALEHAATGCMSPRPCKDPVTGCPQPRQSCALPLPPGSAALAKPHTRTWQLHSAAAVQPKHPMALDWVPLVITEHSPLACPS